MKKKVLLYIILLVAAVVGLQAQDITLVSLTTDDVSCGGATDGNIHIEVTGGVGNINYSLFSSGILVEMTGFIPSRTHTFSNYAKSSSYYIIIDDFNNNGTALLFLNPVIINGPDPIQITNTVTTDVNCATVNDGTISVTATGEAGDLLYTLTGTTSDFNTTGFFGSLGTGTYNVTVTDNTGTCPSTDDTTNLFIDIPPLLTVADDAIVPATCFGGADGSISVTAGGGTPFAGPSYTYNWSGPGIITPSLEDQTGLIAGSYTVTVTDANGCTVVGGPYIVGEADEIIMSVSSSTDVTCNEGNDGMVIISRSGGTPPYSYSWDGQSTLFNSTARNPNNLVADIYDLTIEDTKGCVQFFPSAVEIKEPDPITMVIDTKTDVSCFAGNNGSANITISGGTAPYGPFSWTGPVASALEDPIALVAGVYSLVVFDAAGCSQSFPNILTINEPDDITALLTGSTDALCFGSADGTAQVTVADGTPGYTYSWTGDATLHNSVMPDPTDLIADTYDLEITDANSCVKTFDNIVTIGEPDDITTTTTVVDVLCNSGITGSITLGPTGGTLPYSYAWTGPAGYTNNIKDITGLEAGFYNVTISDDHSCSKDFTNIEVKENTSIDATFLITHLTCNNSADGAIDVSISGGVAPYSVNWTSDLGYSNTTDEDLTLLVAANYTLTVTDAVGCEQVFPVQPVTEPGPLAAVFTKTDATCFQEDNGEISIDVTGGTTPYTFAWTGPAFTSASEDISGLAPGSYSLLLTDNNGCSINYPDEVTIVEPDDILITPVKTDISCAGADDGEISISVIGGTPGYTYLWTGPGGYTSSAQNITTLGPGSYDLRITDNNGCVKDFTNVATIIEPSLIQVAFDSQVDLSCFGDNNGSINITVSGGVPGYIFDWTNSLGATVSNDEDPVGLTADIYSLKVTDISTCSVSFPDTIELTEPPELVSTLSKTDVICYNQANGTITATASGGVGPYEYRRLGFPYQASNLFSGLTAGTYTIYTRDANLCETSEIITVNQPGQITYSDYGVSGSNTCFGDTDATIYVNMINGGVTPYEYTIDGGTNWQTENSFPNLPGGSYDFRVRDANLCEKTINSGLLVDEPFPITATLIEKDDVTECYDTPEGRFVLMGNGGTGTLKYSLEGGPAQLSGEFVNLLGGIYNVQIIDDSLCTKETSVEILRPGKIVFDKADITDVTGCNGDSNGALDVNAAGGTGLIQYSLDATNYQGNLFIGLTAGDYTVTGRDINLCTGDTLVTITEPDIITFTAENATDADCNGASTGTITVSVSGGTTGYTYTLVPSALPPQATGSFTGLPKGDYTVEVTDGAGCGPVTSNVLQVNEPTAIVIDSVNTSYISCNGANDAEIHIYASGGTPPYEYSIDNEATYSSSPDFTGLSAGTYDVFVKDANGCVMPENSYSLVDPAVISLTASLTHVTPCYGGTNGAISATATGGWESFEYSIDGAVYQPTGDFSGLAAGDYTIFVRDTGSCSSSIDITIDQPAEVTATIAKTDYVDLLLGTITISSPAGGTAPYDYSIDGLTGTFSSTTSYSDLVAGSYEVVVRDALGCTYEETIQIFDILPLNMVIDSSDVSCFGADDGFIEFQPVDGTGEVQFSIDDGATYVTTPRFDNLQGDSMYILRAFDADGKEYWDSVYITEPAELQVNSIPTAADCSAFSETGAIDITAIGGTGGYTYNWSNGAVSEDLTNIVAGNYTVTITDNSGCVLTEDVFVSAWIILNADAGEDTTICQGESIILNAVGGNVVMWEPETYLSNQGISDPVANNVMESITYTYTVTETASPFGCYDIDSLTIEVLPTLGIDVTEDTTALEGQSVQLEAFGGPFESYSWIPTTGLDASDVADPVATAQSTIRYFVFATNANGCVESDSVLIEIIENITIYNAFSPNNGDDINQYFEIENASGFPDIVVEVYNRWGSKVFSSVGYSDDKRWDGTSRGKDVPIGTYYYVIIPYPDATPITGNVTIIR